MKQRTRAVRRGVAGAVWCASVIGVLVYGASICTGFIHMRQRAGAANLYLYMMGSGTVGIGRASAFGTSEVSDWNTWTSWSRGKPSMWPIRWWPKLFQNGGVTTLFVPMWMIVGPLLGFAWLVRGWWRAPGAGTCSACGYSLRGLRGTLCPECGRDTSL